MALVPSARDYRPLGMEADIADCEASSRRRFTSAPARPPNLSSALS